MCNPKIETNILSASFATGLNILLNSSLFCYLYFLELKDLSFSSFLLFLLTLLYKNFLSFLLCLVSSQNSKYGPYLVHSSFFKRNASDVIHV